MHIDLQIGVGLSVRCSSRNFDHRSLRLTLQCPVSLTRDAANFIYLGQFYLFIFVVNVAAITILRDSWLSILFYLKDILKLLSTGDFSHVVHQIRNF